MGSHINSLASAFEVAEAPQDQAVPQVDTTPNTSNSQTSVRPAPYVPRAMPPPLPRAARSEVPSARRPSPPLEHRLDDLVGGHANDLHVFLLRYDPGETLLAAGLLVAVLLASFVLTCIAVVLPLPGFVSFVLASGLMVLGLRVVLRASARYLTQKEMDRQTK